MCEHDLAVTLQLANKGFTLAGTGIFKPEVQYICVCVCVCVYFWYLKGS